MARLDHDAIGLGKITLERAAGGLDLRAARDVERRRHGLRDHVDQAVGRRNRVHGETGIDDHEVGQVRDTVDQFIVAAVALVGGELRQRGAQRDPVAPQCLPVRAGPEAGAIVGIDPPERIDGGITRGPRGRDARALRVIAVGSHARRAALAHQRDQQLAERLRVLGARQLVARQLRRGIRRPQLHDHQNRERHQHRGDQHRELLPHPQPTQYSHRCLSISRATT